MENELRRLCQENGLTSATASFFLSQVDKEPITVYIHWGDDRCTSGWGKTIAEAAERALQMKRSRDDAHS